MIHPILSAQARMQTFLLKHFGRTRYGKYMAEIHNCHLGESCFVIGNGPSLNAPDLTELYKRGIDSFAVNRIYRIFSQTQWRPTYYVNTDYVLVRDILDEVNKIEAKEKFIPLQDKFYHNISVDGAHYFFRNDLRENDPQGGFSLDCTNQVNMRGTVTVDCIQLAMHMGYRHIYLLGVDHNFDKVITESGEVIIDTSVKNYFVDGYDADVSNEVTHDLGTTTKAYRDVRSFCDLNGVEILNASRKTKLDVFERVTFEDAVKNIENRRKNC